MSPQNSWKKSEKPASVYNFEKAMENISAPRPDQFIGYDSSKVSKEVVENASAGTRDYSVVGSEQKRSKKGFQPISDFHVLIPKKTPEEWAENDREVDEWERQRGGIDYGYNSFEARLKRSGIPSSFQDAEINKCHEVARQWADSIINAKNDGTNLYIKGQVGRGKTYTACAVMLYLLPKVQCTFVKLDDILREIKATYDGYGNEAEIVSKYSNVPVLCLDDFGKTRLTEWSLPVLFSIIDDRWCNCLPTIFTSQYEKVELFDRLSIPGDEETALAIISRMNKSTVLKLGGEDRRKFMSQPSQAKNTERAITSDDDSIVLHVDSFSGVAPQQEFQSN